MKKSVVMLCLVLACFAGFTGLGFAKSASAQTVVSCTGDSCNGKLPEYTDCLNSAYPIKQGHLGRALINIMFSSHCEAAFVRIIANQSVLYMSATFVRGKPLLSYSRSETGTIFYSKMIGWRNSDYYSYACAGEYVCGYIGYPE